MRRIVFWYGVLVSALAALTIAYMVGFIAGFGVLKHVDSGATSPSSAALAIDLSLLALFGVQHSLMARPAFKRWSSSLLPEAAERSTYVLLSSAALALLFWQWRPLPTTVWEVGGPARLVVQGLFVLGWLILLVAAIAIGPLELAGIERVRAFARGLAEPPATFRTPGPYRLVRHPLMTGFLVVFWAAPTMTEGRLLLAAGLTAYVLVAIRLEERDLGAVFGRRYAEYRTEVPALVPLPRRRSDPAGSRRAKVTH